MQRVPCSAALTCSGHQKASSFVTPPHDTHAGPPYAWHSCFRHPCPATAGQSAQQCANPPTGRQEQPAAMINCCLLFSVHHHHHQRHSLSPISQVKLQELAHEAVDEVAARLDARHVAARGAHDRIPVQLAREVKDAAEEPGRERWRGRSVNAVIYEGSRPIGA